VRSSKFKREIVPVKREISPFKRVIEPFKRAIPQKLIIFIYIHHDIAEILLKMVLNTKKLINQYLFTKVKLI